MASNSFTILALLGILILPGSSWAADAAKIPYATVQPVPLNAVRWTSGFWAERFDLCATKMIPSMWALMEGTNYTQFYQNFRIAAGLAEGRHRGAPFNDGDFYKWFEGACAAVAVTRDPEWAAPLDQIVDVIAKAQRPDGYLHTRTLIRQRNGETNAQPFQDRLQFEMYNFGHLFSAACMHHRVSGKTNFLAVAEKAADFLERTFAQPTPELAMNSICPSHYMGLVELYRVTREPRYLELAKKLFNMRNLVENGSDDNQDRIPFQRQTNAVGHAVRANYLYAGAADLFLETGDKQFWDPLGPIWTDVVERKLYITGGCGALFDGASPDAAKDQKNITRVHQAYGRNYQLPNLTAHNETCANIGGVLWNWRMFLASGEARFIDTMELALYNSVLSGGALDGTNFSYVNPLRVLRPAPVELRWPHKRIPFMSSFCCPPNLVRTLAEVGGYAYATTNDAVLVNLYGANEFSTALNGSEPLKLEQKNEYPWNGRVWLRIAKCPEKPFSIKLRIPGWAKGGEARVNREPAKLAGAPGTFLDVRRLWKAGDVIELDLPMPVQMMEANPLVEETLNQVALKRGPIVYCLESADLPANISVREVLLPAQIDLIARFDRNLLGGVAVLEGEVLARPSGDWSNSLYREFRDASLKAVKARFVPYFAWGNRGEGEMTLWMGVKR